ncbi:hypothetical protein [Candidatus Nanohalovita haloferacivicina]|uniref:hypothetical protein n=1 Tax=Candidatus Nanohalovita haloferacivicina TaxID=2978046 RepID=UPI00325FD9D8|nr:hypothetical protein HBNXNv_0031 [Candidatus Nanohalobia archaeon BNXNv]
MNNLQDRKRLGNWLDQEILEERPSRAILWPAEPTLAQTLVEDAGVEKLLATSPNAALIGYDKPENVYLSGATSHELADKMPGSTDLEYGWALADDTVNSMRNGLSKKEAQRRIIETSDQILQPGGVAVYNLESTGSRPGMPVEESLSPQENMMQYAREMKEILQEDYTDSVEIYEEPDFRTNSPHLVWWK